jgi:hypothetical protein
MTPALSYCTARAFRRGIMPLVEMQPIVDLRADNDRLPDFRLRSVSSADPSRLLHHAADARDLKVPSFRR